MIKSYKCIVCGHIHVGSEPPQNCPVCGVSADDFIVYERAGSRERIKHSVLEMHNCEYIHEGSEAPDVCPVCGAGKDAFEPYVKNTVDSTSDGNIKVLIIGSGIAGLTSAEEIRNNSDNAEITLISGEKHLPYYRLNLTRYLAKETD
jgi:nitrite reductase (NADH) large subunit